MTDDTVKQQVSSNDDYPINFSVDYPEKLGRWSTLLRWILVIPIYIWTQLFMVHYRNPAVKHGKHMHHAHASQVFDSLKASANQAVANAHNHTVQHVHFNFHHLTHYFFMSGAYILLPVFLMIVFRRKYPKWIFDFNVGFLSFCQRLLVYMYFMTDQYPNTDQEQSVHLSVEYPEQDTLHRFLPFVKWFLAIPHYFCLLVLGICAVVVTLLSWFAILFTGRYPRVFFDFNVGFIRWFVRVTCYAGLFITDKYPPFSLSK